jgi:hypothetical protein
MALSDTLREIRDRQQREEQILKDRPKALAEWKEAVRNLLVQIRGFLVDYEQQELVTIADRMIRLNEQTLGGYEISALNIKAGAVTISIEPVGLMVIGSAGRVDMHRQGRSMEQDRAMILRFKRSPDSDELTWHISHPAERPDNPWLGFAVNINR